MNNKKKKQNGFTLIETMVVVVVFSAVMSLTLVIFLGSVRSQRVALVQQKLVMETSYALNRIEDEMREGKDPNESDFKNYINLDNGVIEVLKFKTENNNKTVLVETKIKVDEERNVIYRLQTTVF